MARHDPGMANASVLCVVTDGVEETEWVAPVDLLRRAGVEVVTVSLSGELAVTGSHGLVIQADARIGEVEVERFDALMLPGGPAVGALREDGRAAALAKGFGEAGKLVGAICAAPLVLEDAGVLHGKRFTAHHTVRGELTSALDERVVVDGRLVTSRGAGTAIDFGLRMVSELVGEKEAAEIASAIMA